MSYAQATTTRHHNLGREACASTSGWWSRAAARLIDELIQVFATLPFWIGLVLVFDATATGAGVSQATDPARHLDRVNMLIGLGLVVVGAVLALGTWAWNRIVQQGRTGQSVGKAAMKIALVSGTTGKPVGVWTAFLREVAHVLDGVLVVGYLWPLWDDQKQTLADKLVDTEVAPEGRLACDETAWVQRALA
jgi:uncharacterized RDD family membrane protein YckC